MGPMPGWNRVEITSPRSNSILKEVNGTSLTLTNTGSSPVGFIEVKWTVKE